MNQDSETLTDQRGALKLKLPELDVYANDPWRDDVLNRKEVASRLTNLIQNQSLPFVISIHGEWGTGKTFMLKRWQRNLEIQGFKAIYFNAWEDDFCDDPLLSILGQLADHFKEDGLKQLTRNAVEVALPLIRENALGVLKSTTGITLKGNHEEKSKAAFLDAYLEQKAARDNLKNHLTKLSSKVSENSGQPLVFIIDELDRCRPTFTIELLERVKHIFDVPNIVFVLGINRDELCKSLQSIYGEIDADVYVRRFFDFEFNLPEADSRTLAEYLINKYQLNKAAGRLIHMRDFEIHCRVIPKLWSTLGLSLRDIDYGIRLFALLLRSVPPEMFTHPYLLALLIAMKFKKPDVYSALVKGDVRTSDIMDYIDGALREDLVDEDLIRYLDRIEGFLYCADRSSSLPDATAISVFGELRNVRDNPLAGDYRIVSRRAQRADQNQVNRIIVALEDGKARSMNIDAKVFGKLAVLIDIYQPILRR